jgi:hypothetical protein
LLKKSTFFLGACVSAAKIEEMEMRTRQVKARLRKRRDDFMGLVIKSGQADVKATSGLFLG